jgi:hypothetical protein
MIEELGPGARPGSHDTEKKIEGSDGRGVDAPTEATSDYNAHKTLPP